MRSKAIILSVLLLFTVVLFAISAIIGSWFLSCANKPENINTIFSFGGEQARENYALLLMNSYPDAKWIASAPSTRTLSIIDSLRLMGRKVEIVTDCKNTIEEVTFAVTLCDRKSRIALLSGPYHLRRIRTIAAHKASKECFSTFLFVAVPLKDYNSSEKDYRLFLFNRHLRNLLFIETAKIFKFKLCSRGA